ncbi:SIS domain-containing protein [candidate division KSB1 bacterium]|nr:SIS domain-containing protein [candidate division KSB1 bacterium]
MSDYNELVEIVLKEHRVVLSDVKDAEVEKLLDAIADANRIIVFGIGRMKCAARAFVMRLMHMGLDAHIVFDTTCPSIGEGDLLIVNAACTTIGFTVMKLAKKTGAKIVAITADANSKAAPLCDFTVSLRGQVHGGRDCEIPSEQPMAALFEQTIFVFEDIIIQLLMKKLNVTKEQMAARHINVDGYMDFNEPDE